MRGGEQRADPRLITGAEQPGGREDAPVLRDHMPAAAAQDRLGQPGRCPGIAGNVAQRPHAQQGRGVRAGLAACRVTAIGQGMTDPGVDDQQC